METQFSSNPDASKGERTVYTVQLTPRVVVGVIAILLILVLMAMAPRVLAQGGVVLGRQPASLAQAQAPQSPQLPEAFTSAGTINFQGELTEVGSGNPYADGNYNMRFAIYDADSGGSKKWPAGDYEQHNQVSVEDGLFNTHLGSTNAIEASVFNGGGDRYLQIWVCPNTSNPCSPAYDDLGRLPISSVAYAIALAPGSVINSTAGFALKVTTSDTSGSALEAVASATSGSAAAVYGVSNAPNGAGISGYSGSNGYGVYGGSLNGTGVYGTSSNASGTGVKGQSTAGAGVYGTSSSGSGVFGTASMTGTVGVATATTGDAIGVYGSSSSSEGIGVYGTAPNVGISGHASTNSGAAFGVFGSSSSSEGAGIRGIAPNRGVSGEASLTTGTVYGVYGSSNSSEGAGVYGENSNGTGIYGVGDRNGVRGVEGAVVSGTLTLRPAGVYGESVSNAGVMGLTSDGIGVIGKAIGDDAVAVIGSAEGGNSTGVEGFTLGDNSWAVNGVAMGENGIGVVGSAGDNGVGVHGSAPLTGTVGIALSSGDSAVGVYGQAAYSEFGIGVYGEGKFKGVVGTSSDSSSVGVHGIGGNSGTGVLGYSTGIASAGVKGIGGNGGVGVKAESSSGNPIEAYSGLNEVFRVTNGGEVYADGTFHGGGADFAEMLPAVDGLEPGDVLAIGLDGQLVMSTEAYQPTVVGVYSENPGFLGGSTDDADQTGMVPLAVVGVVPVKASAENGAIQPGDMLVASATPGHAMKAGENPSVGTVIGKALEGLGEDTGVILMLVILQ